MTASRFTQYRPPEKPRKRRKDGEGGKKRRRGAGAEDGSKPMQMVPDMEFSSYYGRPVVKAPPWDWRIATYLFLGGVAGGSAMLGVGAQFSDRPKLRRNSRIAAIAAAGAGSLALVADLGRPERAINMFRVFKLSSPMNVGSWLLLTFSGAAGVAALPEMDDLTGRKIPLPDALRSFMRMAASPAGIAAGLLGSPLAVYTAVLFGDTSVPAWNSAKYHLPFLFVSSASAASGGLGMITTPVDEAGPARVLAVAGAAGDVAATKVQNERMDEVNNEPYRTGRPGQMLKWAERLVIVGGIGAALGGKNRVIAGLSGATLLAASALTRFGVLEGGLESVKDPKYVIDPQKRRLEERRESGQVDDSITTVG